MVDGPLSYHLLEIRNVCEALRAQARGEEVPQTEAVRVAGSQVSGHPWHAFKRLEGRTHD